MVSDRDIKFTNAKIKSFNKEHEIAKMKKETS